MTEDNKEYCTAVIDGLSVVQRYILRLLVSGWTIDHGTGSHPFATLSHPRPDAFELDDATHMTNVSVDFSDLKHLLERGVIAPVKQRTSGGCPILTYGIAGLYIEKKCVLDKDKEADIGQLGTGEWVIGVRYHHDLSFVVRGMDGVELSDRHTIEDISWFTSSDDLKSIPFTVMHKARCTLRNLGIYATTYHAWELPSNFSSNDPNPPRDDYDWAG